MKLAHLIFFSASIINLCQCNDVTEYLQNERIRRDLSGYITNKFTDFVQDKLTQHSKELELIMKAVFQSEGLMNKLLGKFDLSGLRSKFLGSIENEHRSRSYETNSNADEAYSRNIEADRPFGRHRRNVVSGVDLSKFVEFVEEKLMQHSSALEFIVKSVQNSEGLLKKLETVDLIPVESKLFDADNNARRSENNRERNKATERVRPIISPFEQLSRFGLLARRLIENEFGPDDPIPIEETEKEERSEEMPESVEATTKPTRTLLHSTPPPKDLSRNDKSQKTPKAPKSDHTALTRRIGNFQPPLALANDQNPWCASAATCQGDRLRVCGYDARYTYGVGQFEDVCHMLKYNCQANYNFKVCPCSKTNQN